MAYEPNRLGDSWKNLVPEQPDQRERLPVLVAGVAISLVLLCLCVIGGYILYQEFNRDENQASFPTVPTAAEDQVTTNGDNGQEGQTVGAPESTNEIESGIGDALPPVTEAVTSEPAPTATIFEEPDEPPPSAADIEIRMPAITPLIDGQLDDWVGVPTYESSFIVYQVSGWDGSDDLTAQWQLSWDASNLYIAVSVVDDQHVQNQSGNQIFRGDSVDMQFDTNLTGDFGNGLNQDDFQLTLSPGDFGGLPPSAAIFQGTANGQILDKPGGHHISMATQQTLDGYVIEAAIPWNDLELVPSAGLTIGLALNANDNDSPGTAVQEVMKSHVATRTLIDPTTWGTLNLQ